MLVQVYLYLMQDRMIFFPQPLADEVRLRVHKARPDAEEIVLATADGHHLHGWFVRNGDAKTDAPALIYFGGNGEEVSRFALEARELPGVSFALFNYRGYGKSDGDPSEQALFSDALAIYDAVAARPGVDRKRIAVMGRSLGSGVATYLASQRPVAAVVLVTPFDSVAAIARAQYPFVLVDLLLKHPFDSLGRAPAIDAPLLALIAGADSVIPRHHGETLAKAWRGPVTSVVFERADHGSISSDRRYWLTVREFLRTSGESARRL
ncbi:MAG TPA: alpha/beta fold hydrolase [Burkholderiales bacterium]